MSCPLIKNILILDSEGKRIAVKYYGNEWTTVTQQNAFEKSIFTKTQRTNAKGEAEIIMFDNVISVFKFVSDVHFYVTGSQDENELILVTVLQSLVDTVGVLLRNAVEKRTVLENLDLVLLTLDEIIDNGVILETEANIIANRVTMRGADNDVPLSEQTFTQAFTSAREQLARTLLK